jgi:hypothetical protein
MGASCRIPSVCLQRSLCCESPETISCAEFRVEEVGSWLFLNALRHSLFKIGNEANMIKQDNTGPYIAWYGETAEFTLVFS